MLDSAGEVEGLENVLWLTLVCVVLLAGAVLYLFISQRGFQRVDYGSMIDQEEREQRLKRRLAHIEQLIADLTAYDRQRRRDLEQLAERAREELAEQLSGARVRIVDEILRDPAIVDHLLLASSGAQRVDADQPERGTLPRRPERGRGRNSNVRRFLESQRQQQIAGLLEEGFEPREVARILGVSRQEVEMVSTIVFDARSA